MHGMRMTLRILSYYTMIYIIWMVGIPIFVSTAGDREFSWHMIAGSFSILPYGVLAALILGGKGWKFRRTALWVCSILALLQHGTLIVLGLFLSSGSIYDDPMAIIAMLIFLPLIIFTILVIVALKRGFA